MSESQSIQLIDVPPVETTWLVTVTGDGKLLVRFQNMSDGRPVVDISLGPYMARKIAEAILRQMPWSAT
jgi:hypothetical protein